MATIFNTSPLTYSEIRDASGHALHQRWMDLFGNDDLTPLEEAELRTIEREQEKRHRELAAHDGPIDPYHMSRWGIDYSDCVDFPSHL